MKALFTSDWQASSENLVLCRATVEEILRLKRDLSFGVLVHCGDLKHAYNPVDVRVSNFWVKALRQFKDEGLDVFINLGNHDRVGLHADKHNWFPVLRRDGAKCFDEPRRVELSRTAGLAFLPYRTSPTLLRREADDLSKVDQPGKTVLVFHGDVQSARYNVLSQSGGEINLADLCASRFLYCIGGHIHLPQRIQGNAYYVGSPFATDWGEANQRKGYLLVDFEDGSIKKIRSKIPGWYDPQWPKFEETKPEDWTGSKVRIRVPCSGIQNVAQEIRNARKEAEARYHGADVTVIPEFSQESRAGHGKIKASFPDEKKIRIYVQETLPAELKDRAAEVETFLVEHLKQASGVTRENGELHFKKIQAKNFLSFKELEAQFEPGLCVVSGINKDWRGRSNGSGKSSFLQPAAVALFGQTFKGQKHSHWMRRGASAKQKCYVKLWFNDAQGRRCYLFRGRNPKKLLLKVNGEVLESGNRPEDAQRVIEQVSGYTWETLANAIYVDQANSHLMLTGTEAQRKGFLSKLQNLERFERAEKLIKDELTVVARKEEVVLYEKTAMLSSIAQVEDTLREVKRSVGSKVELIAAYNVAKESYLSKKAELDAWEAMAERQKQKIKGLVRIQEEARDKMLSQQGRTQARKEELLHRLGKMKKIEANCPVCFQPLNKQHAKKHLALWAEGVEHCTQLLKGYEGQLERAELMMKKFDAEADKFLRNKELAGETDDLRMAFRDKKREYKEYLRNKELVDKVEGKIAKMQEKVAEFDLRLGKLNRKLQILKYAQSVFKRDGLPAYLNAQICPELNQAAQEYAELFSQSEIQVRFAVDDEGRMDVQVVNAHGGENVEDQSEGEMKIASLITSFAVRSVAPKTNLLVLDEPGDGLDATSARNFARGLKEIQKKFGTIILTSHNPAILSELSDVRSVVVEKRLGISQVKVV